MKNALLALILAAAPAGAVTTIEAAGATFPFPIYSKWFDEYHQVKPDIQINYQSIGSGGGIRQITARTVDFGASDAPMQDRQLFKIDGKIHHIPTVLGAVVPAYNVAGITEAINFTGEALAGIYLGTITRWSDPAIQKENPKLKLPDMPITVLRRSDGSGTTFCWTDYLSKVSPEFRKKVGVAPAVNWPIGLGGKGNEGVAGLIQQTPNSLGYIELVYAKQNNIPYGNVKNKAGKVVKPEPASITAAAKGVKMPKDFRVSIADSPDPDAFPISTYTWLLIYEKNTGNKGDIIRQFLEWMLVDGQKGAIELGYAPLPDYVNAMVKETITKIK